MSTDALEFVVEADSGGEQGGDEVGVGTGEVGLTAGWFRGFFHHVGEASIPRSGQLRRSARDGPAQASAGAS